MESDLMEMMMKKKEGIRMIKSWGIRRRRRWRYVQYKHTVSLLELLYVHLKICSQRKSLMANKQKIELNQLNYIISTDSDVPLVAQLPAASTTALLRISDWSSRAVASVCRLTFVLTFIGYCCLHCCLAVIANNSEV